MRKELCLITALLLLLCMLLSACGTVPEPTEVQGIVETEPTTETKEPDILPKPEWLSEDAIDEAYACLFPLEGEMNVPLAQELLLPLVEAGNAEAQYYWGYIYDLLLVDNTGEGEEESLYWYELSAEQGFAKAYLAVAANECLDSEERRNKLIEDAKQAGLFDLSPEELGADGCDFIAYYYLNNNDYNSAAEWYLKAAEIGSTVGMMNYGQMHYYELGVEQDYIVATDWLLKAASSGNVNAMYLYGNLLSQSDVAHELIDQEYTASLDENLKAAEAGNPEAMYKIGVMYDHGYGGLDESIETALEWYRKAAEAGHAQAMHIMGYVYASGMFVEEDHELAMEWYKKAADAGGYKAMEELGQMYYQGKYVEKNDTIGDEWYAKAAKVRKDEDYYSDRGLLLKTAMEWHQKAADAGFADSMNEIAYYAYRGQGSFFIYYISGYEVYPDVAMEWYQKAADAGSTVAMYNLGEEYKSDQDYDNAMKWYILAYANGHDDAAEQINEMLINKQGLNGYFENYGELISANP